MAMANPSITAAQFDALRLGAIGPLTPPELKQQILKEMSIADSVHDFNTQFYDKIAKNSSIDRTFYGANLFSTINFTYATQFIFPGNTIPDRAKRVFAEQNNKVQAGQLGVLQAYYSKSSSAVKDNIEKYYLKKAIQLAFGLGANYPNLDGADGFPGYTFIPKRVAGGNLTERQTYDQLVGALVNYAQFEEVSQTAGFTIKYIPLVVDVQKRLTNVLRTMRTRHAVSYPNPDQTTGTFVKLAYCLNREMTNDAAGKLNFREPVKIAGINYFVDVDDVNIVYNEGDGIIIGTGSPITFSPLENISLLGKDNIPPDQAHLPGGKPSQALSPWCTITIKPEKIILSILNDSTGNSKTNVRANVHRNARINLETLVGLQNGNVAFNADVNVNLSNPATFQANYKNAIVQTIFNFKNQNAELQAIAQEIYIWFLYKRLGDQLQALGCKKCRKYTRVSYDAGGRLIHSLTAANIPFQQNNQSVFYSYDAIACAFAILNKIPCIYEDAAKNLHVFNPQEQGLCLPLQPQGGGSKFNYKKKSNVNQSGGVGWNLIPGPHVEQYLLNAILAKPETIINIAARIFSIHATDRVPNWIRLYQECQVNTDNFTTYTFNRTPEQMGGAGGPGGEIINVFYLSPHISGISSEITAREFNEQDPSFYYDIVNINYDADRYNVIYDFRAERFIIKGPTDHMTKYPVVIEIPEIRGNLEGVLETGAAAGEAAGAAAGVAPRAVRLDLTIFELINSQLEPPVGRAGEDTFANIFERYINAQDGGGKKDSQSVAEKLTLDQSTDKKLKLIDLITSLLTNNEISLSSNKLINFFNKFLFLKLLYTYEFQLIFDEERYEIDYNTSVAPNTAENQELYCLLELIKFNDKINFIELLIYLNKYRNNSLDPTSFVVNVLVNLAEIFDFTLETTNYRLLELLEINKEVKITKENEENYERILKESEELFKDKKDEKLFDAFYFNNLYNEECNEFLKKYGKTKREELKTGAEGADKPVSIKDEEKSVAKKLRLDVSEGADKPRSIKDEVKSVGKKLTLDVSEGADKVKSVAKNLLMDIEDPSIADKIYPKSSSMEIERNYSANDIPPLRNPEQAGGKMKKKKKTRRKKGRTTRKRRKPINKKKKSSRKKRKLSRKKRKSSRKKN